jgi:hypothetical protein
LAALPLTPVPDRALTTKPASWFPDALQPTAGNQVVSYVYGRCAFEDMADALLTATSRVHRIYLLGWTCIKETPLKSTTSGLPGTLENYLTNTEAQIRAMFWDGLGGLIRRVPTEWIDKLINGKIPSKAGAFVLPPKAARGAR